MEEKKTPKWLLPVGIGCAVLLCLCLAGAGAVYILGDQFTDQLPFDIEQFPDGDLLPQPDDDVLNSDPAPGGDIAPVTGQSSTNNYMEDDFSTDALGWLEYDDGSTIIKYEEQAYSFEITEPDFLDWTYVPASFSPTSIQFDVRGRSGPQDGSFGVNCMYMDEQNHYYVEIDLGFQDTIFAMFKNGEFIPLTEEVAEGQYWQNLSHLETPPDTTNNINVSCTPETITLWINGQFEYEIHVSDPLAGPGEMALFVYAYDYATNGYKVFFDNVIIE